MFRKVLVFVLIAVMALGSVSGVAYAKNNDFSDVNSDDWYYDAVKALTSEGVISGYDDGTFRPLESVHRDAFATMMVKTLNLELEKPSTPWFEDVDKNNWAYKYVESSKYYMTGYVSGNGYYFKPEDNAVREDMAVALVKALKYDTTGNTEHLSKFIDADDISNNLKDYVATAVKHGLMSGSPVDGGFKFAPQSDLTRAETAALLMNLITTEKVVIDDAEKVTFDDMDEPAKEDEKEYDDVDSDDKTAQIEAIVKDDRIVLEWSKVHKSGFKGYKVVASKSDSSPVYPDNGYLKYITDRDVNRIEIKPYTGYNGGDFSLFEPGTKYYFSITTIYEDGYYYGRTEDGIMPGEEVEVGEYETPSVTAYAADGHVYVKWDKIDHPMLDGYKVVASKNDSSPVYPENGYVKWITDKNVTSYEIWPGTQNKNGDFSKFESGEKYYFSITAVYKDRKIPGSATLVQMPE